MESSPAHRQAVPTVPQGREDTFAEAEVGKELEKILSSNAFRDAEGLRRFLRIRWNTPSAEKATN
jgi:hypothetical protein